MYKKKEWVSNCFTLVPQRRLWQSVPTIFIRLVYVAVAVQLHWFTIRATEALKWKHKYSVKTGTTIDNSATYILLEWWESYKTE